MLHASNPAKIFPRLAELCRRIKLLKRDQLRKVRVKSIVTPETVALQIERNDQTGTALARPTRHCDSLSVDHSRTAAMDLSTLPTELIHAISRHLELCDHLLLCRTNSRMHTICVEWIYRVLNFKSPVQLLRCCKAIISRPEAAVSVWSLKIDCCPSYAFRSFHTMVRSATMRMKNLRVICVPSSSNLFRSLSDLIFPQLIESTIPLSMDSYSFLRRNPTVERASFLDPFGSDDSQSFPNDFSHIQPIHMPKLRHLEGPEIAARTIVPGAPVSELVISWWWDSNPVMEYSRGLIAAASSKAELYSLINLIVRWDPTLLYAIAKHTPQIGYLQIWGPRYLTDSSREDFLFAVDNILPSLTSLKTIIVSPHPPSA
ncbi:hypothetical protein MSAN_00217000 [Mycena sanguinolenta]|uniref:F-box domain-containing protein n=1 Tax=Mycena sanguinolenta TaxID=230812 RepID=A0A8H6ZK92_9AGAR|nr:hypothetical protein MSAN_00217000 [Mycena sanguinolenta]